MKDPEERLRRSAVRRILAGASATEVAAELHRSERWVFKRTRDALAPDVWQRAWDRGAALTLEQAQALATRDADVPT